MNIILLFLLLIPLFMVLIIVLIVINNSFEYNPNICLLNLKDHNYNSDIKTCVLISGQVRDNFYQCIMSQKIFIFDPLNVDIFAVFSDDIDDDKKEYVIKLLKPKEILWIKDTKIVNKNLSLPLSCYPMTRKILLCNNLKKKYEKKNNFIYDINIRSRIDLIIKNYIPENIINNIQDNTIYYPSLNCFDIYTNSIFGITDQFLIGNSYSMNIFSNIYNNIINLDYSDTSLIEIFLKNYLINNNVKIIRIDNYKFHIVRNFINNYTKEFIKDKNKNKKFMINYLNIFNHFNHLYNFNNSYIS